MEQYEKARQALAERHEPEKPMVELHRWWQTGSCLCAEEVRNHPQLGTIVGNGSKVIRTSRVKYLNRDCHVAVTDNTVYVLFDEIKLR